MHANSRRPQDEPIEAVLSCRAGCVGVYNRPHVTDFTPQDAMIPTPDRTRCLLLKTDGDAVEDALRARLEERNWQVSVQRDPHVAMAEMCLREWSQKTRASWGLKRLEGMVLVIDAPTSRPPFGDEVDPALERLKVQILATGVHASADRAETIENAHS